MDPKQIFQVKLQALADAYKRAAESEDEVLKEKRAELAAHAAIWQQAADDHKCP